MNMLPGVQRTNLFNIFRFLASRPEAGSVLARKVVKRLRDGSGRYTSTENDDWIDRHTTLPEQLATALDADLWEEARTFGEQTRARAEPILATVPFDMGAGGDYEFLYWLTRFTRPNVIVETGVSAGWTSQAFLAAIAKNGRGTLYSSDFPYFRVKDPESYIGIVVDPELRSNWQLFTEGDEKALPKILDRCGPVDLFHYDSDKSVSGREFGIGAVGRQLAANGIILVDDIRDDSWFREHVARTKPPFTVLHGRCGMIDPSRLLLAVTAPGAR